MSWTWHWWLFLVILVPIVIFTAFARGAMNARNVARDGMEADYNYAFATRPGSILTGTILAGATWAAIVTAVAGFIF